MLSKPSLMMLLAVTAGASMVSQGVALSAAPDAEQAQQTRLGASIQQSTSARDQAAIRRQRALDLREQAARATEERLKAELRESQAATPAPPGRGPQAKEQPVEGEQFDELARIYQSMKPARAAVVFEQLEMDVQMQVAQRMRERSTAQIMANMTPQGAADLSMALARKQPVRRPRTKAPAKS